MARRKRPTLAVWKFASCDGCQLSLLDLEDELLAIADAVDIAYFREGTSKESQGPFDVSIADGSITTTHDAERIRDVRRRSGVLVALGACATAGGIQALRNFRDVNEMRALVYPSPEYLETLATSTAFSDHVKVDFELRGCPIDKRQLVEVLSAFLNGRKPNIAAHSTCIECKLKGNVCVLVKGEPCMGPVTHAGCGGLCPSYHRGCYGCFGPSEAPNTSSLTKRLQILGQSSADVIRAYRSFNAAAPAFRAASEAHEEEAKR